MKRKNSVLVLVAGLALAFSCSDKEEFAGIEELSDYAKNFIGLRTGAMNAMGAPMNGAINRSFQNLYRESMASGGRMAGGPNEGDTTIVDNPWEWETCATVTEFTNEDGSFTTIRDYGDGCEEGWGEFTWWMFGKITETYRYALSQNGSVFTDDYFFQVIYDNFGGRYYLDDKDWKINGGSHYEGSSSYDTANSKFSGSFTYSDETTYSYGDENHSYQASGETDYNEEQWVMNSGSYRYGDGNNYYHSTVLKPLVYKYNCFDASLLGGFFLITYVSGREQIEYKDGDNEGSFIIDYGNGKCDNVIVIIENGKQIKIDLSDNSELLRPN